ncbi:MAG: hypothetical protein J0H69_08690 [Burkholderiales bacterium]|nr:hypothetical protein [Burkholderiales bacterium]
MSWDTPWTQRSLAWHLRAAVVALGLVGIVAATLWLQQSRAQDAGERAVQSAQAEFQALRDAPLPEASRFGDRLTEKAVVDDVVRDVGRHAQALNLQVKSLAVQAVPATPAEYARIQLALSASGDYPALKTLLADLLGRFPALGVQSLSLRRESATGPRVEMQATLALWVKD